LKGGRETRISLDRPVPVHLVYRTAIAKPDGGMAWRDDVYGRDAVILDALRAAGVGLPGTSS
jgi:murein L,D-transpeptidase YcbB/YkuD